MTPAPLRRFVNTLPPMLRRQKLLTALHKTKLADPVQLTEFNGNARAYVDLRDAESRAVYLSQSFWPEFPPMVAAFLRSGGDFFDVGANFGLVTFGTVPLIKGVRWHLFEANARIIPLLHQSAALWPGEQFKVNHCCVSDRHGITRLTLPDACWGHAYVGDEGEPVTNLILDEYVEQKNVERIGFLKMDIEGWEAFALRGMARTLSAGKVAAAFIEADEPSQHRVGKSVADLCDQLRGYGFDLYFCGMWDAPDPYALRWARVDVNGTSLRFASAYPLPDSYKSGDVLAVHHSSPLSQPVRAAVTAQSSYASR